MFVLGKNSPGYKDHVIFFIALAFEEGFTIIDWTENLKPYNSEIVE